jgi:hypothetical protein
MSEGKSGEQLEETQHVSERVRPIILAMIKQAQRAQQAQEPEPTADEPQPPEVQLSRELITADDTAEAVRLALVDARTRISEATGLELQAHDLLCDLWTQCIPTSPAPEDPLMIQAVVVVRLNNLRLKEKEERMIFAVYIGNSFAYLVSTPSNRFLQAYMGRSLAPAGSGEVERYNLIAPA